MSSAPNKLVIAVAVVVLTGALAFGGMVFVENRIESEISKELDMTIDGASLVAAIGYQTVEVSLLRKEVLISGITVQPLDRKNPIHIQKLRLGGFNSSYLHKVARGGLDLEKDFPETSLIEITGLELPVDELPPDQAESIRKMGFETLSLNLFNDITYDSDAKIFNFEARAGIQDMGEVAFKIELGEFDMEALISALNQYKETDDLTGLLFLTSITIRNAELRYEDHSLISRIDHVAYEKSQTTLSHELKKYRWQTAATKQPHMPVSEAFETMLNSVQVFLDDPNSISIFVAPPSPLPIMSLIPTAMQRPKNLMDVLNTQVIANP